MTILIYLHHPAHFHLFKHIIKELKNRKQNVIILATKKDILENLLTTNSFNYINVLPKGRKDNKLFIAIGLIKQDIRLFRICFKKKPDLLVGTSTEITHIGKILGIPSIFVNEDDVAAIPLVGKLAYPYAKILLTPRMCTVGKWESKKIDYDGYHELTYLHPNYFNPSLEKIDGLTKDRFFILRFAKLTAHHDVGKNGLTSEIAERVIKTLSNFGKVYITSEKELESKFEKYRINIEHSDIHHALYYATLFIGDSQTMAAEAAVLGTPSIRFNDFVGKLNYLEELEHKYGLTYGIKTSEPEKLFQKIDELLAMPNLKEEWQKRRMKMLADKIDVTAFMVWFIENYPESVKVMKENPDFQDRFRLDKRVK